MSAKITNACACAECQAMCHHPCWPTPDEARDLIKAGFGHRMRCDYWVGGGEDGDNILVLSGALKHRLGDVKPEWPNESGLTCTFFVKGRCQLHNKGLKPLEGRTAHHSKPASGLHEKIAKMWNTKAAQKLATEWIDKYGKPHEDRSGAPMSSFQALLGSLFG